jgi:hypothetical protein
MKKALLLPLLAGIVSAAPATASASVVKGVVISRLPARGEVVVAAANGHATALRAPLLPAIGSVIRASTFRLADGTWATRGLALQGHVRRASFHGVLIRTVARSSFFSAGGSIVVVHRGSRSLASARSDAPLAPGEAADVEVTIAGGALDEDAATPMPAENANELTLQVTVTAVTPATATTPGSLTLSINGQTLVLALPAGTVLPADIVANATASLKIEFAQPEAGDDENEDGAGQGDDDATVAAASTASPTTATTTTVPSTSSGHHEGDHGDGGHGGGD